VVIVLLLWLYLSNFIIPVGAEINAVIERSPAEGWKREKKRRTDPGRSP
jgi:uncharacterized BrkB/YihY/UPF0761 family membrane protein